MKLISLALTTLVFATGILYAQPEIKGNEAQLTQYLANLPRTVNLLGEAEIKVPADRAIVSVRVVKENKSLQEASRVNQELRAKMQRVLAEQGIPAARVQASRFSSTPKYGMFGEKAKGYRVENVVKITADNEKEFQAIANLVDATPEFRHEDIEFEHSDKDGLKKKVLEQAIAKAIEKKGLYEEKLGVKLTVKGFSEGVVLDGLPGSGLRKYARFYSDLEVNALTAGLRPQSSSPPLEPAKAELPTSFAELGFKAQIVLEYLVESK